MIRSNSINFFLHVIPLLLFSISSFSYTSGSLTPDLCRPDQRDTLLEFKNEFKIRHPLYFHYVDVDFGDIVRFKITSYPKTEAWGNNSDCCRWDGITCDVNSGVVIGLDLSCSRLHGNFKPNSSLLRLKHLRNLNLAYNNFTYSPIPAGLNKLTRLERLNISKSSFSGQIPTEILHLTKLVSLDLSSTLISSQPTLFTSNPFLHLLAQNLKNLKELDMSFVNISSEIPETFSKLASLRSILLRKCYLFGRLPRNVLLSPTIQSIDFSYNPNLESYLPEFNGNNSLILLDLSETSLLGNIPDSINNLKHLNVLRFQECSLTGKIPSSIGNLLHLTSLFLSHNNFTGKIPSSFQNLNRLAKLFIDNNKLTGKFPTFLLNLTKLSKLSLRDNKFTGTLPRNMSSLSKLESFDASGNSLVGTIPSSLFDIPSLAVIDLNNNQFNDTLQFGSIASPSKLLWLDVGSNNTTIDLNAILSRFKGLYFLDLSGNHVPATNMSLLSEPLLQLRYLKLSGCGIREFPEFARTQQMHHLNLSNNIIKDQVPGWLWSLPELATVDLSNNNFSSLDGSIRDFSKALMRLDLSNNIIKDQVPGWLWSLPKLELVDLSNNSFSGFGGSIRDFSKAPIEMLDLSKNNFSGEIPESICGMSYLQVLDLSNNNFNGSVPQCFNNLIKRSLSVLNLGDNNLAGKLPEIFFHGSNLRSLNVGNNKLVGKLPRSLSGSSSLEVLNVVHNRINDTFPFWLESLQELKVMVLHSNEFHGSLQYHPKVASWFPQLRIIDISHNAFTGALSSNFFTYFSAMSSERNLSELKYIGGESGYYQDSMVLMNKGVEMEYTRILTLLTAIDFSVNKLQGKIPNSIGLLKNLKVLNLSSNGFRGNIPSSLSNLTEMESLDLSRNKLSGQIPPALAQLTSLSKIMVSHNQLVGPIPKSTQFDTQDALSFEGNRGLCGRPLTTSFGDVFTEQSQEAESEEVEEEEEGVLSWTAAAIALAPGLIFGLTIGHFLIIQKTQWFMKISCMTGPRRRGSVRPFQF